MILAGKDEKKEFEKLVAKLSAKGRAAGIHLVLATQRPDRTVLTGLIKSNLPLKICFKVVSAVNSNIVLEPQQTPILHNKMITIQEAEWVLESSHSSRMWGFDLVFPHLSFHYPS